MSTVQLRALHKTFDDGVEAVVDVDLTIPDGGFYVLLGPSGCGKTTVLRMVAGLDEVTSGEVIIDGVCVNDVPTRDRGLAMLFQSSTLYPHLSVRDNIGFPLRLGWEDPHAIDERVMETAGMLGIAGVLDLHPHQLSGGQRQRVAMARAIIRRPTLLLMDEPMSNLDAKLRTELRSQLTVLHRRLGATTIYVTHDQVEAMSMADQVVVMRDGRIVQQGTPGEVYDHPLDVFVAQFVGSPSMSLLRGVLNDHDGRPVVEVAGVAVPLSGSARSGRARDLPVVVGVRADAFVLDEHGAIVMDIGFLERLGSHVVAHGTIDADGLVQQGGHLVPAGRRAPIVVALEAPCDVVRWQPLYLAIDPRGVHVFDALTGRNLAGPRAVVAPLSAR